MGIFIKRPLFLFCCVFLGASLVACCLGGGMGKIWAFCVFSLACALFGVLGALLKKRKYGFIQTAIACAFAALAFAVSFIAIEIPRAKAERHLGEFQPIEFTVLGEEYSSRFSTRYYGVLESTDAGELGEKAYLTLEHEADFKVGDRLVLVGDVERMEREESFFELPEDVSLNIISTTDKDLITVKKHSGQAELNIPLACAMLREYVKELLISRLDIDSAAMSLGFITGDCSMLSSETVRDFRRTGLSHLLAVSGLHLTVLFGVFEVILTGMCVKKGKRCIIMSFLALLLLFASAFSASACRSVLMLLCTYLCYMLSRDSDTLTALGVSGALIVLMSPSTVGDIGFWLSFFATFGLVAYLELFSSKYTELRYVKTGAVRKTLLSFLSNVIGAIAISLCANVFICVVFWLVFGEMSVIFPIANLLIAPMGNAYLVLSLLVLFLGGIPYLGSLLVFVTQALNSLTVGLTRLFSSLDFSVVSLRYGFAGIIVVLTTLVLFVLLFVKLRYKIFLYAPPVIGVVAFCICLSVYNAMNIDTRGVYINEDNKDSLVLVSEDECVIVDVSDGTYSSFYEAYNAARELYVAEIESVVLTHYHARHIPSMDIFFRTATVRKIYLPMPSDKDELNIMCDIVRSASECGVDYYLYERQSAVEISDSFAISVFDEGRAEGSDRKIISFAVMTDDGMLCYADSSWYESDTKDITAHFASCSDVLILGAHGPSATEENGGVDFECPSLVVSASVEGVADSLATLNFENNIKLAAGVESDGVSVTEFEICADS